MEKTSLGKRIVNSAMAAIMAVTMVSTAGTTTADAYCKGFTAVSWQERGVSLNVRRGSYVSVNMTGFGTTIRFRGSGGRLLWSNYYGYKCSDYLYVGTDVKTITARTTGSQHYVQVYSASGYVR